MKSVKMIFESATIVDNDLYFFCKDLNLLCQQDLITGKCDILGSMPKEDIFSRRLCGDIQRYGSLLIIIPLRAKAIWIYNISTSEWTEIDIPTSVNDYQYFDSYIYGNTLYMIGYWQNNIISINLLNFNTKVFAKFDPEYHLGYSSVLVDGNLYVVSQNHQEIKVIDLQSGNIETIHIEIGEKGFYGIAWDENNFWLISMVGSLIKLTREFEVEIVNRENEHIYPRGIVAQSDYVLSASLNDDKSILMHDGIKENILGPGIIFVKSVNDKIYYETCDSQFVIYDSKSGQISFYNIGIEQDILDKHLRKYAEEMNDKVIQESDFFSLNLWVSVVGKSQ